MEERQVSVETLVTKLRARSEELSYQCIILESLIEDLEKQNAALQAKIYELAPAEEIQDGNEEG